MIFSHPFQKEKKHGDTKKVAKASYLPNCSQIQPWDKFGKKKHSWQLGKT